MKIFTVLNKISNRDLILLISSSVISITVIVYMLVVPFDAEAYVAYGYIGVGLANLLASAPPISLMPSALVTFVASAKLASAGLVIIATFAASTGELVDYFLGDGVDKLVEDKKWHMWLKKQFYRSPFLFLVIWVALPNPIQAVGQIFAGSAKYPVWKYYLAILIGNAIWFSMVVSFGDWLFANSLL